MCLIFRSSAKLLLRKIMLSDMTIVAEQETPPSSPRQRPTIRQLSTNKNGSERVQSPLKKLQQHSRTKHLRITTQKRKEEQNHVACIIPSPRRTLLSTRRELPSLKSSPCWERESESFISCLGHCTRDSLWSHPTQKLKKLRHIEIARDKEEKQGYQY